MITVEVLRKLRNLGIVGIENKILKDYVSLSAYLATLISDEDVKKFEVKFLRRR